MSPSDVPPDEMGWDPTIADKKLQGLLAGEPRDSSTPELARFVNDLQAAFPATEPAAMQAHLAAIADTAHLLAENGDPVARPVSSADAPVPQVVRLPKRRGHDVKDRRPLRAFVKVLAPAVAMFAILGTMASAGALPRPVQHVASTAAGWVGLDIPTGDAEADANEGGTEAPESSEPPLPADVPGDDNGGTTNDGSNGVATGGTADATDDDQGEDADDQGEDGDDQGEDNGAAETEDDQGDNANEAQDENDQGDDSQGDTTQNDQGDDGQGDQSGSVGPDQGDQSGDQGTSGDDQGGNEGDSGD